MIRGVFHLTHYSMIPFLKAIWQKIFSKDTNMTYPKRLLSFVLIMFSAFVILLFSLTLKILMWFIVLLLTVIPPMASLSTMVLRSLRSKIKVSFRFFCKISALIKIKSSLFLCHLMSLKSSKNTNTNIRGL